MKTCLPWVALLYFSLNLNAQLHPWHSVETFQSSYPHQRIGYIHEKENSFLALSGHTLFEYTHHGQLISKVKLGFSSFANRTDYFFVDELEQGDTSFIFTAQRGDTSGEISLRTFLKNSPHTVAKKELNDVIDVTVDKGPTGIKIKDNTYLFFGQEWLYKVEVSDINTIKVLDRKPIYNGLVTSVKKTCAGYITCTNSGVIIHYDKDLKVQWVSDLGFKVFDITAGHDAFYACGVQDSTAMLKKTDLTGNLLWEKSFEGNAFYSILMRNNQELFITGEGLLWHSNLFVKTDLEGNLFWTKNKAKTGVYLSENKYGAITLLTRSIANSNVYFMDEQGNSGDLIDHNNDPILNANNITTTTSAYGLLFSNNTNDTKYHFPKGASTKMISSGTFWMAGYDQNGAIHAAIQAGGRLSYKPGPYGTAIDDDRWYKVWKMDTKAIHYFRKDIQDGQLDYPVSYNIINWPAKGNPHFKLDGIFYPIENELAPFVDVNKDGIYNYKDGDYPKIKGDQMLWWVFHDREIEDEDYLPFDVEIHGSLYAFHCGDEILDNSTFLELAIHNKSENTYYDLKTALNTHFTIGCITDDLVASLPDYNTYYAYNEGEEDHHCWDAHPRFTESVPLQSITYLNHQLTNFIYYRNAVNIPPPLPFFNTHFTDTNIYGLMNSYWQESSIHLTYGGQGADPLAPPTDFAFPGNPADSTEWSMCQEGLYPGLSMVSGSNMFDLAPNQTLNLHYGLLTHTDIEYKPCADINPIKPNLTALQEIYDQHISTDLPLSFYLDLGSDLEFDENNSPIVLNAGLGAQSYLWSTGETSSAIRVTQTGEYTVEITTALGCTQYDTILIKPYPFPEDFEAPSLLVYPNPSLGHLCIILDELVPDNISLHDVMGQKINDVNMDAYTPYSIIQLDLHTLEAGVYIITSTYSSQASKAQRIILHR